MDWVGGHDYLELVVEQHFFGPKWDFGVVVLGDCWTIFRHGGEDLEKYENFIE